MLKRLCGLGLLIAIMLSSLQAQNNTITPTLLSVKTIDECGSINDKELLVLLTIGKITKADSLFGYNFEIKYDPSKIKFNFVSTFGTLSEFFEIKQFTISAADSAIYGTAGHLNPFLAPVEGDLPLLALQGEWLGDCFDTSEVSLSYIAFTEEFKKDIAEPQNATVEATIADKPDRKLTVLFSDTELIFDQKGAKQTKLVLSSNGKKVTNLQLDLMLNGSSFDITSVNTVGDNIEINNITKDNGLIKLEISVNNQVLNDTLAIEVMNNSDIGKVSGWLSIDNAIVGHCDCITQYEINNLELVSEIPDTTTVVEGSDETTAYYSRNCDCITVRTDNNDEKIVRIYDINGKMIYLENTYEKHIRINAEKFARGIYIVEIDSKAKKIIKNLIKY
ncbi:MAG TPA: T9SS type A sorting domain-containing protein [Candidatus Kapabacteria bacterium]|nr:T9SS type A sorting domain-containing protein [Candidatus Kapabacteria bacterium]